jgi:exopolysaccharide biosynthesis polyprenyl glycosylphosphotransferase
MKRERSDIFFTVLLIPVDAVALVAAGALTWYLRFEANIFGLGGVVLTGQDLAVTLLWLVPVFLLTFAAARLYINLRDRRFIDELFRVILAISTATLALIVVLFFSQELETSRFVVIAGWIAAILFVTLGRFVMRQVERAAFRRGRNVNRVIIVGDNETSRRLRRLWRQHPEYGVRVVAVVASEGGARLVHELKGLLGSHRPHELIMTDHTLPQAGIEQVLDFADEHRLRYKFTPNVFETQTTNIGVSTVAGIPIVELKATPLDGWGRVGKRAMDLVGATAGVVVLSPIMLALALGVKLSSKGPILIRQARVDRSRTFTLYKFRSMYDNVDHLRKELADLNERSGPLFKIKNDPRVTPFGRFIRKTSLDELPQFFNVIKGDMSLVGPRPHRPEEIAQYERHHKKLLRIKPGITGLAAISGRSDLDFEDEVRLDTYYIEHWSLFRDLKILVRTIPAVLSRRAAV